MGRFERWAPYVPVAQRRRNAENEAKRLAKNGAKLNPLRIAGRNIAKTFWGKAWCENLEDYCDFDNRMPRGRTYARNGSVVDLQVNKGKVTGLVSGSSLYKISIVIDPLSAKAWGKLCQDCSQEVLSLLELMRGKLSNAVIQRLTDPKDGLFPKPKEIKVTCSCPDYASMCKHVAAVLYGVGHRLDSSPEMFFALRGVDQTELVTQALASQKSSDVMGLNQSSDFATEDLGSMFGIDLAVTTSHVSELAKSSMTPAARRSGNKKGSKASSATIVAPKRTNKKVASKTIPVIAASPKTSAPKTSATQPAERVKAKKGTKRDTLVAPARKKISKRKPESKR